MSCYHPLKAFYREDKYHKKELYFIKHDYEWSQSFIDDRFLGYFPKKILIPCGQCIGCRLEYSRQWAMRIMAEASLHKHNYFVTLTYDDVHLPLNFFNEVDLDTGELIDNLDFTPTLDKSHLSSFLKDLRQYFSYHFNIKSGIRFYGCGEYGDLYGRPHYHLILFNCPIPDLKKCGLSKTKGVLYKSDILSKIWKKGIVRVNEVNFLTASYCARYMTKKHKGLDSSYYEDNHILPEFSLMSRRPGIGGEYFDLHFDDMYTYDSFFVQSKKGIIKTKPPKFFDRLYDIRYPDSMYNIKINRMKALKDKFLKTDKSYDDYLEVMEKNKLLSLQKLPR